MHSPEHKRKEAEDLFNRVVALYESDKKFRSNRDIRSVCWENMMTVSMRRE